MPPSNHHGGHGTEYMSAPCLSKRVISDSFIDFGAGQREGTKVGVGKEGEEEVEDLIRENAKDTSWTNNGSDTTKNSSILAEI